MALLLSAFHVAKGNDGPFAGTTIGGYTPEPSLRYSDWVTYERERRKGSRVTVLALPDQFEVTLGQLGVEVDVRAMLNQAERQRHAGGLVQQLRRWVSAKLSRQDLVILTRFDVEQARSTLLELAKIVDRPSVNAEVDLQKRRRIEAKSGLRLDVEATLAKLETQRDVDMTEVWLVLREVHPTVTADQLSPVDLNKILSSFETSFQGHAGPRAINIRVAAKALNGVVISPGELFSFNQVVGPRVESRGYREAPVIKDDEVEPGVGGGVCQVATTLHAAIVLAGFDVLERRSHSRPSAYASMGLDATVVDGEVDLKFRNPYDIPLLISTSFPERYRLRVEIIGMLPSVRYEHSYGVRQRYDYYRRVVTKTFLPSGTFQRKQKGIFGYDVVSTVVSKGTGKGQKPRQYRSRYWPVPEVYWVGPNTDLRALPPLPEGAVGVQQDGVTVMGHIPKDVEERSSAAASAGDLTDG
jgi:vancomycin resistance protein YoaR